MSHRLGRSIDQRLKGHRTRAKRTQGLQSREPRGLAPPLTAKCVDARKAPSLEGRVSVPMPSGARDHLEFGIGTAFPHKASLGVFA